MHLCLHKMCFFVTWKHILVKFLNIFKTTDIFSTLWPGVSFENKNKKVSKMGKMILLIISSYWHVAGSVYYTIYWNLAYKNTFGTRERWLPTGNKKFYHFPAVRIMLTSINLWSNKIKPDNELSEIYCL